MRATETAHWLEWRDWGNPIIAEPFRVKNGFIHVRTDQEMASRGMRRR
jgi:mandelate racemase